MHYHNKITFLLGVFLVYLLSVVAADEPTTNALISVENPKPNQVLAPGQQLMIQYTVHSASGTRIPPPNYPSSMDVFFKWVQNNNTKQVIQLKASGGLETDTIAGGGRDKKYLHRWKLPNCRFFKRYQPTDWSFSLVFDPHYPEMQPANNSGIATPLGPRQASIIVPISVSFNLTIMDNRHIKGCS